MCILSRLWGKWRACVCYTELQHTYSQGSSYALSPRARATAGRGVGTGDPPGSARRRPLAFSSGLSPLYHTTGHGRLAAAVEGRKGQWEKGRVPTFCHEWAKAPVAQQLPTCMHAWCIAPLASPANESPFLATQAQHNAEKVVRRYFPQEGLANERWRLHTPPLRKADPRASVPPHLPQGKKGLPVNASQS